MIIPPNSPTRQYILDGIGIKDFDPGNYNGSLRAMSRSINSPKAWEALNQRLEAAGETLVAKADWFRVPSTGTMPIIFRDQVPNQLPFLMEYLLKRGDPLLFEDFIRPYNIVPTTLLEKILERDIKAAKKLVNRILEPKLWIGYGQEARWIYEEIGREVDPNGRRYSNPAFRSGVGIAPDIDFVPIEHAIFAKTLLKETLDGTFGHDRAAMWRKLAEFVRLQAGAAALIQLAANGQWLTPDELRHPVDGRDGETWFYLLCRHGLFPELAPHFTRSGHSLSADLVMNRSGGNKTVLEMLGDFRQLPVVFVNVLWQGRANDVRQVIEAVSARHHTQRDAIPGIQSLPRLASLAVLRPSSPAPAIKPPTNNSCWADEEIARSQARAKGAHEGGRDV
ncbi:MAG: hypothetical protein K2Q12_05415 [Rickettsiales bacterium]|nr:hypothetical protein [Rickettsiales bacterium]